MLVVQCVLLLLLLLLTTVVAVAVPVAIGSIAGLTIGRCRSRWNVTIVSWWHNTAQRAPIEHEHSRASLQTRIAALTLPVTVARFAQRHVAVGVLIAQRCHTFGDRTIIECVFVCGCRIAYDASGSRQRSLANRSCARFHCTAARRCTVARLLYHSNMSSSVCKTSHGQRCHTANRNARWRRDHLKNKKPHHNVATTQLSSSL